MASKILSKEGNRLRSLAKNVLDEREYTMLKGILKTFTQDGCVVILCSSLLEIVNSTEKADLLVEVRQLLPKAKRSEFSAKCRELLTKREPVHGTDKLRKRSSNSRFEKNENSNPQHSPPKRAKQENTEALNREPLKKSHQKGFIFKPLPAIPVINTMNAEALQSINKQSDGINSEAGRENINDQVKKHQVLILERDSNKKSFGFKIQGDLFTEMEIIVSQVYKDSIAQKSGLKRGDRITRINNFYCKCARKADVIKMIKTVDILNMRVISCELVKEVQYLQTSMKTMATTQVSMATMTTEGSYNMVTVYADGNGWLGCSVRGGIDYACNVHLISVEDGSPAERAGLKKWDVILEVNGTAVKGRTHVQVVRLIITATAPITFTIQPRSKRRRDSQRNLRGYSNYDCDPDNNPPHTPLRICHWQDRHAASTPEIPQFHKVPLPGYPHDNAKCPLCYCGAVESPSTLPLHAMNLACTPPPAYTAEPPTEHRVLQKGSLVFSQGNKEGRPQSYVDQVQHIPSEFGDGELHTDGGPVLVWTDSAGTDGQTNVDTISQLTDAVQPISSNQNTFQEDGNYYEYTSEPWDFELNTSRLDHQIKKTVADKKHSQASNSEGNLFSNEKPSPDKGIEKQDLKHGPRSRCSMLGDIRSFNKGSLKTLTKGKTDSHTGRQVNSKQVLSLLEGSRVSTSGFHPAEVMNKLCRNGSYVNTEVTARKADPSELLTAIRRALEVRTKALNSTMDCKDEDITNYSDW